MTRYEKILDAIKEMDTADLVSLHNAYCDISNNMDDYIYSMDEFDEIVGNMQPWEVARCCYYGHEFCPAHAYFWFNGYANLESSDYFPCKHGPIYLEDIAAYIDREEDTLENDEIQDILDEMEEEEEDVA